ncbi:MAG: PD-(D/E)XK nuclease family protein [Patescibacteria group bacterium]
MANGTRVRNIFDPSSSEPFKLSRSKLEFFLRCPRCFYMDRRLGVGQPSMPAFSLNNAVDALLKKEYDVYRHKGEAHPLMRKFGIEAVPMQHPSLEEWRDNRRGVRYADPVSNFLFFGAIDDVWLNVDGDVHVVDYKSTSVEGAVTLEGQWKVAYKRQVEMYQWLLRRNDLPVSNTAFFVYVNADKGRDGFGGKLEFSTVILPHDGDDSWVAGALQEARLCLEREALPAFDTGCEWCMYRKAAQALE